MGLRSGAESVPLRGRTPETMFLNRTHQKRFIQACHRGYEKAQSRTLEVIRQIGSNPTISDGEKDHWQLLLRKIIDGIVTALFRGESHVLRRLIFHPKPPKVSLEVAKEALIRANALNAESRLTFALVADLTTVVHVCDIVRVDFRDQRKVSLIELKSGKVNEMLLAQLEAYTLTEDSINRIAASPLIVEPKHRLQAQRILRQKLRLLQIHEVLATDSGIDIQSKHPIRLSREEVQGSFYDKLMNDLLNEAREAGMAAGVVNYCVHIGVGFSERPRIALRRATDALRFAISTHLAKPPAGFADVFAETKSLVADHELFKTSELLSSNLVAMNVRTFTLWGIDIENLMSFVKGDLVVLSAFDVSAFMWLARRSGLNLRWSTRREAAEQAQKFGSINLPTWDNRALTWNVGEVKNFVFSGLVSRLINDLSNPLPFLEHMAREAVFHQPFS